MHTARLPRVLPLVLGVLSAGCGVRAPAAVPGAAPAVRPVAEALLPDVLTRPAPHQVELRRAAGDSVAARLLRIAEAAPPEVQVMPGVEEDGQEEPKIAPGSWWSREFDGIRLPVAVTADAVRYYLELSDDFRRGDFSGSNGIEMGSSRLRYTATVEHAPGFEHEGRSFGDVYVARLHLSWSNYCGMLCALNFEQERVVVLDRAGRVLAVSGDGPASTVVS